MNRRHFLKLTACLAATASFKSHANSADEWLLSCQSDSLGKHYFTALDTSGALHFNITLPGRGHSATVRPHSSECIVFARRPGQFLMVVDIKTGTVTKQISGPEDRHYYGHGAFDSLGQYLYTTENNYETGEGVIGVYDAMNGYHRIGEFSSHGVGPHELKFLNDGRTLVVANGGIRTHPDSGRSKLNLADMAPNLTYINVESQKLIQSWKLPENLHQLSIRHIDISADDTVFIGMQYQGQANQHPPLVAIHTPSTPLKLLSAPENIQAKLKNYCGSVRRSKNGNWFAITSPRGGIVTFWSAKGTYLGDIKMADGCGLAMGSSEDEMYISSGTGKLSRYTQTPNQLQPLQHELKQVRWDNHMNIYRL